jgi:hypothetical protein
MIALPMMMMVMMMMMMMMNPLFFCEFGEFSLELELFSRKKRRRETFI